MVWQCLVLSWSDHGHVKWPLLPTWLGNHNLTIVNPGQCQSISKNDHGLTMVSHDQTASCMVRFNITSCSLLYLSAQTKSLAVR